MSEQLLIAASALAALLVIAAAVLKGWQDWLALKTRELDLHATAAQAGTGPEGIGRSAAGYPRDGAARIELADLKERIRKLEAIASGVDL
jgi:hypothetical protein